MSQPKTDPEVYRRAWEDYQACCKKEGFLPVVRYCKRHQLKEGRFYEWLRRRGIKLSEVQERMRRDTAHCVQPAGRDSFMAVEVGDVGAAAVGSGVCSAEVPVSGIAISLASGHNLSIGSMAPSVLLSVLESLSKPVGDVGR